MALKVMLLIAADTVTGPVKGVFQLIENLNPGVVEICLYDFRYNDEGETLFLQAARERGISVCFLEQKNRSYLYLIRQVILEIRKKNLDVIQTHGYKPTFLGFFARFLVPVKWICFMHGTTHENIKVKFYNLVDNILQLAAHRTVLVSMAQRNKVFGGHNSRRVQVLHNAVDLARPMAMDTGLPRVRDSAGMPGDSRFIVAIGRFSPEKGLDVLLEAFALLVGQIADVHLVLVGDGQEKQALQEQTSRLGLTQKVHFAGFSETPGNYVAEADVVALPSRSEGIPNVVLEAMAMGKPVVATTVGGVPEIIEDGVSGRLVPPEQPVLLARGLADVLTDQVLYQRLAVEGKRRVQEFFSIEARVGRLEDLYRQVSVEGQ